MCGIAGAYQQPDGKVIVDHDDRAPRPSRSRRRRGAGDRRSRARQSVLAHRRLSIIDLSSAADQPLVKDGLSLSYNGELYNYRELRRELERPGGRVRHELGHRGRARGVARLGRRLRCERFRGMFAFAMYDDAHSAASPWLGTRSASSRCTRCAAARASCSPRS